MKSRQQQFEQASELLKAFTAKNIPLAHWYFFSTLFILWSSLFLSHYFFHHFSWGLVLSIPLCTLFMCRSYVIEHDCGHGSFYRSENANSIAGNLMGFGILIPYSLWKHIHHSHHLNVGNLDKRAFNPEIWTMTVDEYQQSSIFKKLGYRFMRSKFTRFTITPTINLGLMFRFVHPRFNWKANISVIVHDILYIVILWKVHCVYVSDFFEYGLSKMVCDCSIVCVRLYCRIFAYASRSSLSERCTCRGNRRCGFGCSVTLPTT